jgi:signal transduction histidine kinase
VWIRDYLVLARWVSLNGQTLVQGAWLNWALLQDELLDEIRDLLPAAELRAASPETGAARLMATLPVMLEPGPLIADVPIIPSPLRGPLALAWGCVLLAAAAVGALLVGAVRLSERRAAFVSAVTHELRTPLTTFRMYSEMLAENMVPDASKRRQYLETLCAEGSRLDHLVENVLSFARLERGRDGGAIECLTVGELLARVTPRLEQRAVQVEMELELQRIEADDLATWSVDVSVDAVERILFNLVDNACKYAAGADDRRIVLTVFRDGHTLTMAVCDYGPGVSPADRDRLFRAFAKSAKHAAESAPGVGLGLALSRRLARKMGGELRLAVKEQGSGARFVLTLPCDSTP